MRGTQREPPKAYENKAIMNAKRNVRRKLNILYATINIQAQTDNVSYCWVGCVTAKYPVKLGELNWGYKFRKYRFFEYQRADVSDFKCC